MKLWLTPVTSAPEGGGSGVPQITPVLSSNRRPGGSSAGSRWNQLSSPESLDGTLAGHTSRYWPAAITMLLEGYDRSMASPSLAEGQMDAWILLELQGFRPGPGSEWASQAPSHMARWSQH
eukprot:CAMPEP_0172759280 /NCGR_PEP_ID=MMETSP1074-20121228/167420_1 /TAXON_ID=2916 /ORGANISM="Ceratium fusus, Strain PA161109" /LENGTH=120 /DNA_ID=CAMNT_0013593035 /DNA_START=159 /DNA_END=519 /DNA_ORIENTATION=-